MRKFSCGYQGEQLFRQREGPFQRPYIRIPVMYLRIWCGWSGGSLVKKSEIMQESYFVECCGYAGIGCRVKAIPIVRFEKE